MTDDEVDTLLVDLDAGLDPADGYGPLRDYIQRVRCERNSWKAATDHNVAVIRNLERHVAKLRPVVTAAHMVAVDPDEDALAILVDKLAVLGDWGRP